MILNEPFDNAVVALVVAMRANPHVSVSVNEANKARTDRGELAFTNEEVAALYASMAINQALVLGQLLTSARGEQK